MLELLTIIGLGNTSYATADYITMNVELHDAVARNGMWGCTLQVQDDDDEFYAAWQGKELILYVSVFDGETKNPIQAADENYKNKQGFLVSACRVKIEKGKKHDVFIPFSAFDYNAHTSLEFQIGFYNKDKCVGKQENSFGCLSRPPYRVGNYPELLYACFARFFIALRDAKEPNWHELCTKEARTLVECSDICPPENKEYALSYINACVSHECPTDAEIRQRCLICDYPQVEKTLAKLVSISKSLKLSTPSDTVKAVLVEIAQALDIMPMNYNKIIGD